MGPTNCGKGHMIRHAVEKYDAYAVSVGNLLREKYGPDFFNGQQAPEHCRDEAKKMMLEGINNGIESGASIIMVDGQPREPGQMDVLFEKFIDEIPQGSDPTIYFLLLHCPDSLREQRVLDRDKDPAALELSKKRFAKDLPELQNIFYEIARRGHGNKIIPIESSDVNVSFDTMMGQPKQVY